MGIRYRLGVPPQVSLKNPRIVLSCNQIGENGFVLSCLKVCATYLVVITKGGEPGNDLETVFWITKSPPVKNLFINGDRL